MEVYRAILERGALSPSMKKGTVVLLFKVGDRCELKNWCPLTLLNADYKVLAKVATERLKIVIGSVVSPDQVCGVPGRSISWNLLLVRDVIDWVKDWNLPLALVNIDQEKAFDRVQHQFLSQVLQQMGFGENFQGWLRTLYNGVFSAVRVNGHMSRAVMQAGGVHQGCPLSPLLYVLTIEPFAQLIRQDRGVDGVPLPGAGGERLKVLQYAHDTTLFVSSAASLLPIRTLTDVYAAGSGARVNLSKS